MRILVVEDERKIADFIRKGLTEHGYAVDVAFDGEEALDWPAVADFDIIILDVMLPVRDGVDVCRTLRQRGVRTPAGGYHRNRHQRPHPDLESDLGGGAMAMTSPSPARRSRPAPQPRWR